MKVVTGFYKCKIFKLGDRKFNITSDGKLYELRKKGTRRIKGEERVEILGLINKQIEDNDQFFAQLLGKPK